MMTLAEVLTGEQYTAVTTALSLRAMGSSEKTIIRAFAQEGKENLLAALFVMVDHYVNSSSAEPQETESVEQSAGRGRRKAERSDSDA